MCAKTFNILIFYCVLCEVISIFKTLFHMLLPEMNNDFQLCKPAMCAANINNSKCLPCFKDLFMDINSDTPSFYSCQTGESHEKVGVWSRG